MKREIVLILLCAIWMCSASVEQSEPPLKYTLTINGESYPITLNNSIEISGTFTNPKISISAATTRNFEAGGIQFEYPAAFTWDAEKDNPESQRWILSGNSFKIIFVTTVEGLSLDTYVESIATQFGTENCQIVETTRQLGNLEYQGKILSANLVGYDFSMEIFAFPDKNHVRFLVLQWENSASEADLAEQAQTFQLLQESFRESANF